MCNSSKSFLGDFWIIPEGVDVLSCWQTQPPENRKKRAILFTAQELEFAGIISRQECSWEKDRSDFLPGQERR